MAVLYPRHFIGERFEKILAKSGIPINVVKDHGNHIQMERDEVRFLSMHNAKGLEFPCVAIGGLGELKKAEDIEDDIRLTYVAITRAMHEAFITYSNMSELVERLVV
ncbi:MAG: 3'-5' exonuclease [Ferrovum myxofaciens]